MNVMLFLIVSIVVHSIPVPFSGMMFRPNRLIRWLPLRLVWGTGAWVLISLAMAMTLPWAVISLIMSVALLIMISGGFRPGEVGEMIEGLRTPLVCVGFMILLILPMVSGVISWTSDVSNAESVDEFITQTEDPLFTTPIPDAMVRLVTSEF
ncbi:MAG: hypothetical protein ACW992_03300, partial [Candidatus Thorarchaeota archaeon]